MDTKKLKLCTRSYENPAQTIDMPFGKDRILGYPIGCGVILQLEETEGHRGELWVQIDHISDEGQASGTLIVANFSTNPPLPKGARIEFSEENILRYGTK